MRLSVFALVLIATAAPAAAQVNGGGGTTALGGTNAELGARQNNDQPGTNAQGERLQCRRIEDSVYRNRSRRVCQTAEQWREYDRNN